MRRGRVLLIEEDMALIVFEDIGIQKKSQVMNGVTAKAGDTAVVLCNDLFTDCVVIGTVG